MQNAATVGRSHLTIRKLAAHNAREQRLGSKKPAICMLIGNMRDKGDKQTGRSDCRRINWLRQFNAM